MSNLLASMETVIQEMVDKAVEKRLRAIFERAFAPPQKGLPVAPSRKEIQTIAGVAVAQHQAGKAAKKAAKASTGRGPGRPRKGEGPTHGERILSYFEAMPAEAVLTPLDIGKACKLPAPAVNNALKRLTDAGMVTRVATGQYSLVHRGGGPATDELTLHPPPVQAAPAAPSGQDIVIEDEDHAINGGDVLSLIEQAQHS
jgi:hypothetical protein